MLLLVMLTLVVYNNNINWVRSRVLYYRRVTHLYNIHLSTPLITCQLTSTLAFLQQSSCWSWPQSLCCNFPPITSFRLTVANWRTSYKMSLTVYRHQYTRTLHVAPLLWVSIWPWHCLPKWSHSLSHSINTIVCLIDYLGHLQSAIDNFSSNAEDFHRRFELINDIE